mmetsp:Transcript_23756/g.59949  ORF Transcript_23756/g.59949 Transcript_23756/m.59949 type:complete len:95 (-) Transcript_23756:1781-2065(-)
MKSDGEEGVKLMAGGRTMSEEETGEETGSTMVAGAKMTRGTKGTQIVVGVGSKMQNGEKGGIWRMRPTQEERSIEGKVVAKIVGLQDVQADTSS